MSVAVCSKEGLGHCLSQGLPPKGVNLHQHRIPVMTFTDLRNSYKCIYPVVVHKEMASRMDPMASRGCFGDGDSSLQALVD